MKNGNGYMGKVLFVDLTTRQFTDEVIGEDIYKDFLGGYGLGVRILYQKMKPGTNPLGPDNILGFIAGTLTGTGAISSGRFSVVAKSPLTGTWGDSNSGGYFGPQLKRTGYDGVFFTGKSDKPVYVYLTDNGAEIKDASHLWGKDTNETEKMIKSELPGKVEIASIGPSGEKLSLISCLITDRGRAAGRSGLGAVMGSKNLKAFVVGGRREVKVADRAELRRINKIIKEAVDRRPPGFQQLMGKLMKPLLPFFARRKISFDCPPAVTAELFAKYGTCGGVSSSAAMQDSPIKNWKGTQRDFPMSKAANISDDQIIKYEKAKYGCAGCPVKCGGIVEQKSGKYALKEESHKPEYETLSAFGSLCLNNNPESIILASDICNRYGLDTISAGSVIAFTIECFEAGLINKENTGIELRWGDPDGMIAMLKLIAERQGFGDVLADGVRIAASKIGHGAEKFAVHIGGQEAPMHDPKLTPAYGATYVVDPTPGRHTAGGAYNIEFGMKNTTVSLPKIDKHDYARKGETHFPLSNLQQVMNSAGLCMIPTMMMERYPVLELLNAATGWNLSLDELLKAGERIQMVRHCFNVREGFKPGDFSLPPRVNGESPLNYGPHKGTKIDTEEMRRSCLRQMGVDETTGKPRTEKIRELGLESLIQL